MARPHQFLLTALLISVGASAQVQDLTEPARSAPPAPVHIAGLQHEGDRLLGIAPSYKVWLDARGFEFVPALGRRAPRELPLRFELSAVGRSTGLRAVSSTSPEQDGLVARYRYDELEARYEMRPDAMEQSFAFTKLPPGSGDLVVRGRIDTELHVEPEGPGLRLSYPGVGSFTIGGVTGIDAEGRTCPGTLRLAGDVLELTLPEEFVETAALPLVLDPLIGGVTLIGQLQDNESPDIAYNQLHDRYLVTWHVEFSSSTADIAGALIEPDGTPFGTLIAIEAGADRALAPKVATVASRPTFAVVWKNFTTGDLVGRGVSAVGNMVSPVTVYSATGVVSYWDLGGEGTTADDEVILVLSENDKIRARQINIGTGWAIAPFSAIVDITDATDDDFAPAISSSGGTTGRHCIAWVRRILNGPPAIYAAIVSRNLGILDDSIVITSTTPSNGSPAVDGDGNRWVVAYQKREPNTTSFDTDVYCRTVAYDPYRPAGDRGVAGPTEIAVESNANDDEGYPAVAWMGDSVLVAFLDVDNGGWTAYAKSLDPFDCAVCEGEFTLSTSGTLDASVAVASQYGGNPASGQTQVLAAWHGQASGTVSQVNIRRFDPVDGVASDSLGGGCGSGGTPRASCARVGNGSFDLRLLYAAPNAQSFVVASATADLGYSCGTCVLLANPFDGFVAGPFATSAGGDSAVQLPIPNSASLDGAQFVAQWFVVDGSPTCAALGVEVSDALSIRIQQ